MNHNDSLRCEPPVWGEFTMKWPVLRGLSGFKRGIRDPCKLVVVVPDARYAGTVEISKSSLIENPEALQRFQIFSLQAVYFWANGFPSREWY